METAGWEPQLVVLAVSVNGDVSCAPFEGVVTVMANNGETPAANARRGSTRNLIGGPLSGF
jgi:hypothetical protein